MINVMLFVLIFVTSYLLAKRLYVTQQVKKFKKRNIISNFAKENFFKKLFSKINLIKTKENDLFLQGYPLKLNAISYYLMKILLATVLGIGGFVNYHSLLSSILLACIGYFFLDFYMMLNKKTRDSEICNDLLTVTNSITMQLASYVPLKDSLKMQYENCRNKDFKKAMMMFATKYELSELNIDEALKDLNSRFDILEVDMFCNTIRQYNKVGDIIDLLENLSFVLKEKYIKKMKDKTREKILYITFGVVLALSNIILITFYPLFISIGNNFNQIFK